MSRWLVTGASGALGRQVVAQLQQSGETVIKARSPCATALEAGEVHLDCTVRDQVESAIRAHSPDHILHLAATFTAGFDASYALNVVASRHLLECVEMVGQSPRIVLLGSAAEYGLVRPEENPIRTDHALNPVSTYGLTKAWQAHLVPVYCARGLQVMLARIFNLDGPGISAALFSGRVRQQAEEVRSGKRRVIEVGQLSAVRDYVSTGQAASQLLAISRRGRPGKTYHVASGTPTSMGALLDRILTEYGLDRSHVEASPAHSNHRGPDVPAIYADMSGSPAALEGHAP